jgi:hypothetical protein
MRAWLSVLAMLSFGCLSSPPPVEEPTTPCRFGARWSALVAGDTVEVEAHVVLTASTPLTHFEHAQVLAAVRQSRPSVRDGDEAFAAVDRGEIEHLWLRDRATARRYLAFVYGTRGATWGAIFRAPTLTIVAAIEDDRLACTE